MGLDPNTFYTAIKSVGLSRDFLFRVNNITLPPNISITDNNGLIYAKAASYPGRIIEDMVVNSYGQEYHLGGRALYLNAANYRIEFYVPGDFKLRELLESASRAAHEDGKGVGDVGAARGGSIGLKGLIGPNMFGSKPITLEGVQIRTIGEINYLIADGIGEVVSFEVTFAYQKYKEGEQSVGFG